MTMDADAEVPPGLQVTAFQQGGIVTRRQALDLGMTPSGVRRMVESGRWRTLARGVYAVDVPVWHQMMWAGLLVAGDGACVGGRAAGHLYGIEGPPPQIDIWVPPGRSVPRRKETRRTPAPGVRNEIGALGESGGVAEPRIQGQAEGEGDWVSWRFHQGRRAAVGDPPRTTVEETVLDICREKLNRHFRQEGEEENPFWFLRSYPPIIRGRIRSVLGPAMESGLTTAEKLHAALDRATNLEGGALIGWEIDEMEAGRSISSRRSRGLRRRDPRGVPHPPTD